MEKETQPAKINKKSINGCCNGAPISNADACCKLDEEKKAEGSPGCGCTMTLETKNNKKSACC